MKRLLLAIFGCLLLGNSALSLLLTKECVSGPVHWCANLDNAKQCNAVNHCFQTVWGDKKYPVDTDSVCQICKDMVGQARDQLRSNETESELEQVLEAMCFPIPVPVIKKKCESVADDFALQLVDVLSSQMNPDIVCSVAGLCNNAEFHRLMELEAQKSKPAPKKPSLLTCSQCNKISGVISDKFHKMDRDQVLEKMLIACRGFSSYTDGCSAIVLSYFNDIYKNLKNTLNAESLCHMTGTCAFRFHEHEEDNAKGIEVVADSQIGVIDHKGDDIPCDLCKQLVVHLRDLLVANTTEEEFKKVIDGLCKQTGKFQDECQSLSDQYFQAIYSHLKNDLDPENACFMIGICPKGFQIESQQSIPIRPLVPSTQLLNKITLGANEPQLTDEQIQAAQLPKDQLILNLDTITIEKRVTRKGTQFCTLCEYFLHFVQDALASPKNEENIKNTVLNSCHKLPPAVQGECQEFVDTYGDAVIALLIQDLDPAVTTLPP